LGKCGWATALILAGGAASKSGSVPMTTSSEVMNPVPNRLARVVPADIKNTTLGAPGAADVFVTAARDI